MDRANHGSFWAAIGRMLAVLMARAASLHRGLQRRRSERRLRLSETLSLGEKRFLAIVQFRHQEFLVGGTGNSIALLAKLDAPGVTAEGRDGIHEDGL